MLDGQISIGERIEDKGHKTQKGGHEVKRGIASPHAGSGSRATGNRKRDLATARKHLRFCLQIIGLGLLVVVLAGCEGLLPCCW